MQLLATVSLFALVGCANSHDLAHLKSSKNGGAFSNTWEKAPVNQFRALATPATLKSVQSAKLSEWDRIVFTFSGRQVPSYTVQYQGGEPLLEMRFGARPVWGEQRPGLRNRSLNYPVIKTLSESKIGEEYATWVAALSSSNEYRVTELSNPPRVVVDLKH